MDNMKSSNILTGNFPRYGRKAKHLKGSGALQIESFLIKKNPPWKRSFDIIGSFCGLVFLSPLLVLIGIFIKVTSPGPLLFKQKRVGSGGKPFTIYKFRTMKTNADSRLHKEYLTQLLTSSQTNGTTGDPMHKITKDPRVIPCGELLRVSGMDELPQLINVFMGHMSLVGPRPPIPYEVEQYPQWYKSRFDVIPGLTGLWQVSGKNRLGFNEMIRYDIQYAMKRSFLLDCKIILMTPYAVFIQIKDMIQNLQEATSIHLVDRG